MIFKIKDLMTVNRGSSPRPIIEYLSNSGYKWLKISDFNYRDRYVYETKEFIKEIKNTKYVKKGTLVLTNSATPGIPIFLGNDMCLHDGFLYFTNIKENVNLDYIFYWFQYYRDSIVNLANGSVFKNLKKEIVENLEIDMPSLDKQEKIINILKKIDLKIEQNNQINNNLEKQLEIIFNEKIMNRINDIDTTEFTLYDEFDVIDNRGKTPLLVDNSCYPIIDVKVLSGTDRIINYNNCLKFVSENTYNTFFRSGHPQKYDTLLSTVGSLAEMKLYLENKGTIAQNVVALRHKHYYPLFMYQYLLKIRSKLTSYDIGSVQPSIKVTQFMKEKILIPNNKDIILEFENIANIYTMKMLNIFKENQSLEQLRNTLLPKLMNGEIDLDNIEI